MKTLTTEQDRMDAFLKEEEIKFKSEANTNYDAFIAEWEQRVGFTNVPFDERDDLPF